MPWLKLKGISLRVSQSFNKFVENENFENKGTIGDLEYDQEISFY